MKRNTVGKKLLSIILSVAVCVSFTPLFGGFAFADDENADAAVDSQSAVEEVIGDQETDGQVVDGQNVDGQEVEVQDEEGDGSIDVDINGTEVEVPTDGTEVEIDAEDLNLDGEEGVKEEEPENIVNIEDLAQDTSDGEEAEEALVDEGSENVGVGSSFASYYKLCTYPKQSIKYKYNVKTDKVTLNGSVKAPWKIIAIYVSDGGDAKTEAEYSNGSSTTKRVINMKKYSIGYHTLMIGVANMNTGDVDILYKNFVPNNIYIKPSNKQTYYETYPTYIFYKGTNLWGSQNYETCELFLDYRLPGARWHGPTYIPGNSTAIGGFSPNKSYQFRSFYRVKTSYAPVNGSAKTYYFDGRTTGAVSPVVTCKTGFGKLPIKSVKVKAYKVKKHKHKYWSSYYYGGWYTGGWVKETYYTYKIKVTVKMKKKPGVLGVVINGKTKKGNKKKYTAKFGTYTSLKKPKKLKFTVKAYGYQNNTYKAYSSMYSKKKKIK